MPVFKYVNSILKLKIQPQSLKVWVHFDAGFFFSIAVKVQYFPSRSRNDVWVYLYVKMLSMLGICDCWQEKALHD